MKKEKNVPEVVTREHIGTKILYRLPNNAIAKEGVIEEFSPEEAYVRIGKTWLSNDGSGILAFLSGPKKRREAL